jgi:hypothetical protein
MTGAAWILTAFLGPASFAWVAWCWVLVRREDGSTRLRLAEAQAEVRDAHGEAARAMRDVLAVQADVARISRELAALTDRVQGVQLRQGMR